VFLPISMLREFLGLRNLPVFVLVYLSLFCPCSRTVVTSAWMSYNVSHTLFYHNLENNDPKRVEVLKFKLIICIVVSAFIREVNAS